MEPSSPRVFICEDHSVMRKGLADLFAMNGITVVGEASTVKESLEHAFENNPDVVLLDLMMDEDNSLEIISKLRQINPEAKIVVYSMREGIHTISASYKEGVLGYVTKSSGPELLLDAVHEVAQGNAYFMPGLEKQIALYYTRGQKKNPREVLSDKELQIFIMLAKGKNHEEIAEALGLSPKSIANRVVAIKHELNCAERDFHRLAEAHNLIKPEP